MKSGKVNKNLKKIARLAEIDAPLSMHMSRHAFAHLALEKGVESAAIKDLLGHSNLATTERYMGGFDTSRTDGTIKRLFQEVEKPKENEKSDSTLSKEEQAIELLKGMTLAQIMAIIGAINK